MAARSRNFTEIEEQARRLRRQLGIDELHCPDLIEIFRKLPVVFPGLRLVLVPDDELQDCEAEADCVQKLIRVRKSVYDACLDGKPRAQMTLAHELGHIALGHSGIRYRKAGAAYRGAAYRQVRREESEAKQFAAVFLAPTYLARECKSIDEMGEKFGIIEEASNIRFGQVAQARNQAPPSARWKSSKAGPKLTHAHLTDAVKASPERRERELPSSVVDFLLEARSRGRRITSLRGRDDDD